MQRPAALMKRDLLVGVLAGGAVAVGIHPALDIAAEACLPLFEDYVPDMRRWYPIITPTHARAAIAYAGRAFKYGALTPDEYDWICEKARMAIIHKPTTQSFALSDFPGRLGVGVFAAEANLTRAPENILATMEGDDDGPEAA